jgi:hypothetical protein
LIPLEINSVYAITMHIDKIAPPTPALREKPIMVFGIHSLSRFFHGLIEKEPIRKRFIVALKWDEKKAIYQCKRFEQITSRSILDV